MGVTRKPVIKAGDKIIIVISVEVKVTSAKNTTVINTPVPKRIKSKGRNNPRIKFPFLVFAGIK